ncbi:ABC transporter permease, partial [Candidatus Harpocratesius sp.]
LTYGILGIPGYTRLIRGTALQEKNKTYVEAAKVAGANKLKIMFKHILPNCLAPIIVAFTFDIGGIILSLAGLSFLGFSDTKNPVVEWGTDINYARNHIYDAPWAAFTPGFGILLTVLAFMLVGDGLRDALDPRLQGRKN